LPFYFLVFYETVRSGADCCTVAKEDYSAEVNINDPTVFSEKSHISVSNGIQPICWDLKRLEANRGKLTARNIYNHFGKVNKTEFYFFGIINATQLNKVPKTVVLQHQLKIQQSEIYDWYSLDK
jgi:hypothetical protein